MFAIVQHTPPWAFAVLALLIWLGARALRPRTVPVWRLLFVPAAFVDQAPLTSSLQSL